MAQTAIAARRSTCDIECLDRSFLADLQSLERRVDNTPSPAAVWTVHHLDVDEDGLQSFCHALCCSMLNCELLTDFIEADPGSPSGSQPR